MLSSFFYNHCHLRYHLIPPTSSSFSIYYLYFLINTNKLLSNFFFFCILILGKNKNAPWNLASYKPMKSLGQVLNFQIIKPSHIVCVVLSVYLFVFICLCNGLLVSLFVLCFVSWLYVLWDGLPVWRYHGIRRFVTRRDVIERFLTLRVGISVYCRWHYSEPWEYPDALYLVLVMWVLYMCPLVIGGLGNIFNKKMRQITFVSKSREAFKHFK